MDERRTAMGLGNQPETAEDDGETVRDEELMGPSETEHALPELGPRYSSPRISQRVPRLSVSPGVANEGDVLVNRYRVERLVARSPHEIVLEASHLDLGQRVLLRYLSPLASTSPEAVARFQRGARKARELRSEHAERVIDFGRLENSAPYRAVELPHGPSLAEILRVRGALPIAEAVDIVLTACEPVAEAHAAGIVHRCLSVSNIFVERRSDGTPLVRVLDFGVSDPLEPDWVNGDDMAVPAAGLSPGALRFASPEQIRNPGAVDARADVWALGAILYELLAGAPLFQGDSSLTLLAMIAADTPTPLGLLRDDVPAELEALVLSCLEKDPEARPRSVVDVVLSLSPFASAEAQPAAARVARIVMRTTRPPPMPGHRSAAPPSAHSTVPGGRNRALVRSSPPPRPLETVASPRSDARGFSMLFAGAAIGLGAALLAPRLAPPAPASAPQAVAPAAPAVAPAAAARGPDVVPLSPPVAAAPVAAAPVAVAPGVAPVAVVPRSAPRVAVERAAPVAAARLASVEEPRAPARPERAIAAPSKSKGAERATTSTKVAASADELFGGLD